jgi:hypothetical protein
MLKRQMTSMLYAAVLSVGVALPVSAAPVIWVDWQTGTAGANGSANGVLNTSPTTR